MTCQKLDTTVHQNQVNLHGRRLKHLSIECNSTKVKDFLWKFKLCLHVIALGIFLASFLYNPLYSSLQNLDLINSFFKKVLKRIFWDKIINKTYNWSYNYGYMDAFYETSLTKGIIGLIELYIYIYIYIYI